MPTKISGMPTPTSSLNNGDVVAGVKNGFNMQFPMSDVKAFCSDGLLAAGDNVSALVNDAGYITSVPVISVAGKTGAVTLVKADITDFNDGDYATAAQGATADSALQPGDNISALTNDVGYVTELSELTFNGIDRVVIDNDEYVSLHMATGATGNGLLFWDSVGMPMGTAGFVTSDLFSIVNSVEGGQFQVMLRPTAAGPEVMFEIDPDSGQVELYNTVTGGGLERALTVSDLSTAESALQPGDNISELANDSGYLAAEVNDLTAAVVWANVPDVNITQSSVTQHQAALTITESQISDLQNYALNSEVIKNNVASQTIDGGVNTSLMLLSDDNGESVLNLYGSANGTGRVYVGRNETTGGGIEYNGDNSPISTGAGSNWLSFYRVNNGVYEWTARNRYNDNTWNFRTTPTVGISNTSLVWHQDSLSPVTLDTTQTITGEKTLTNTINLTGCANNLNDGEGAASLRIGNDASNPGSITNSVDKAATITMPHFDTSLEDFNVLRVSSTSSTNRIEYSFPPGAFPSYGTMATEHVFIVGDSNGAFPVETIALTMTSTSIIFGNPVNFRVYTVAGASLLTGNPGEVIYVVDGDSGSPCLAVWDGTSWKRSALGATISDS